VFEIYACVRDDHDLRLVILAGLICIASSAAAVILLRHARDGNGTERTRWLVAAGMASGFGIWATHFIAMIGYDPGVVRGYALVPTIASLLTAIAGTSLGFWVALRSTPQTRRWGAAAVVGIGIAAMHYIGMQAVEIAGEIRWSAPHVLASIVFAIVPISPALSQALDRNDARGAGAATILIVTAILLLHFTGMAGISIIPSRVDAPASALLSPLGIGIAVAATAFSVLAFSMLAALMSARARSSIMASEREFKVLVQGISDCAIYMLDTDGRVASWNAGAQRLKGYSSDEAIGLELERFYSRKDALAGLPRTGIETARRNGKFSAEGWRYRKDGTRFWAHVTIEAVHDDRGLFHGFAKITRDMTHFKEHQDNLDAALSNMHQGLCLFGRDERLIISNDRFGTIFGLSRTECAAGTSFEDVVRLTLEKRAGGSITQAALQEVLDRHREYITRPEGGTLIVPYSESCTLSIAYRPMAGGGWVSTYDDITERRRAEHRIEHMALHDGLTDLPNRSHYTERLDAEISRVARTGERIGVVAIDLDRFKEINDVHGHAAGDAVLCSLADRMRSVLASGEIIARVGGDEFAAFKPFKDEGELSDFLARLESCLTLPIELDGLSVVSGASFGVAIYPSDATTREQIANYADLAMYRAKSSAGTQIAYYEQGMDEAARARRILANDLRQAIARDEMSLAYQVQKSVLTEEITGYEALLRWEHPENGAISPNDFIPIAEETGEILRIGEWVLRSACHEAARWPDQLRVAVNLSAVQLMYVGLPDIVASALLESGLPGNRLELEITETALVADKVRALHVLRQIKAMGVAIALDDFGTGYSSLDTLNSFPFDKIKIDKSFLLEANESHQARAIIRAVLALGRSLNMPVLAEGLENDDQLELLQSEGCDEAQGFLWGRPTTAPSGVEGRSREQAA
jgi:diguanylate cyclase (GGDEF)-like protein/PAS domain S-box-containing protein